MKILGIELGSTRIKAVAIDQNHKPVSSGDYTWASRYENGIWTYDIAEVWQGLKTALSGIENREQVGIVGISGMFPIDPETMDYDAAMLEVEKTAVDHMA